MISFLKKETKKLLAISLLISALFVIKSFCLKATDGFSLLKIRKASFENVKIPFLSLSLKDQKEVEIAIKQRYFYLGKGAQCYVFASEDGKYVLKFLKSSSKWPLFFLQENKKKTDKMLKREYNSYLLALEKLKEETALLFLHLSPTQEQFPSVVLVDKLHISHCIDLNAHSFLLQKRANSVCSTLSALIEKEDLEGAKLALNSLVELISIRSQKGVKDNDCNLLKNFGFIGKQAIQIDVGRFEEKSSRESFEEQEESFLRKKEALQDWLNSKNPILGEYFKTQLNTYFASNGGK